MNPRIQLLAFGALGGAAGGVLAFWLSRGSPWVWPAGILGVLLGGLVLGGTMFRVVVFRVGKRSAALYLRVEDLLDQFNDYRRRGMHQEAAAALDEAFTASRTLARTRPRVALPVVEELLIALSVLHLNLRDALELLDRHENAAVAAAEAVAIARLIAHVNRAFRPEVATALHGQADSLVSLGRHAEALALIKEGILILRSAVTTDPDPEAYWLVFGRFLILQSRIMEAFGYDEKASVSIDEAVKVDRTWAGKLLHPYSSDHSLPLRFRSGFHLELGRRLAELGRNEEAGVAAADAVEIRRLLWEKDRDEADLPELAAALLQLAEHLSALGRSEEAVSAGGEAVEIHRVLADGLPPHSRPQLAEALKEHAVHLAAVNRHEEAKAAAEEAALASPVGT